MRSTTIDTARRREVAARHHLDPRTLDRAIRDGAHVLRGLTRDRALRALEELDLLVVARVDSTPPPRAA